MSNTLLPLPETRHFRRIDAASNMARFYMLSLEPTLFGDVAVFRHWGRIGTRGRQVATFHGSVEEAQAVLDLLGVDLKVKAEDVVCVGGSWVTPAAALEARDYDTVTRLAAACAGLRA